MATTIADITAIPKAMRGKSPASVAKAIYAPRPLALSFVGPQLTASATMLAFQAPPTP